MKFRISAVVLILLTYMQPKFQTMATADVQPLTQRIVFLGDSITDGHTYPLMVQQALREAGHPVPIVINAGVGGDTAEGMSRRIDRDVLAHKPTLVTVSVGINDAIKNVPLADYAKHITAIADRLRHERVPLMFLTTSVYGAKHAEAEKRADEYNSWLRTFAAQRYLPVADVNGAFRKTRAKKGDDYFMEPDAVHPNWEGQRLIARAVLDALGYQSAVIPEALALQVLPGVLSPWRLRAAPGGTSLSDDAAKTLLQEMISPQFRLHGWTEYSLPEVQPLEHPWQDQERRRGFAMSVEKVMGTAKSLQGLALLQNDTAEPQTVYFNVGGHLQDIWLNGARIYSNVEWRGWHAGRERVNATLQPGRNVVLIESGSQFFLSVTPNNDW